MTYKVKIKFEKFKKPFVYYYTNKEQIRRTKKFIGKEGKILSIETPKGKEVKLR